MAQSMLLQIFQCLPVRLRSESYVSTAQFGEGNPELNSQVEGKFQVWLGRLRQPKLVKNILIKGRFVNEQYARI